MYLYIKIKLLMAQKGFLGVQNFANEMLTIQKEYAQLQNLCKMNLLLHLVFVNMNLIILM